MNTENVEDIYTLSPMQEGMLFHSLYAPEANIYLRQQSCALEGQLDVAAFERAWQSVFESHPILRTSFFWEEVDKPLQVVHSRVELPLEKYDWREMTEAERAENLETFLQADRFKVFELSRAPLMRLALIRMGAESHHFVWSYHHLLLDGWSKFLLFKEVFSLYEAYRQQQDLHLPSTPPYRDYIKWLKEQDISRAQAFWRQTLGGFVAPTPLGVDRPSANSAAHDTTYAIKQIEIRDEITSNLRAFGRTQQLTLNTLVQGAWALLLNRYSGQDDVVFGATVSGRPPELPGVESIIGVFINTLPVRVQISNDDLLVPWLKRIQEQQLKARQYEYSSLVQVQSWSDVPQSLPLFESIVVFENYPVDAALRETRWSLEIENVRFVERNNYPLSLVSAHSTALVLLLSYDCTRFNDETIDRMLEHLEVLLGGMAANPEQKLSDLSLLTRAEHQQLFAELNTSHSSYNSNRCLHELFEAQVERTPHQVALVFEDHELSYAELNSKANQLAHHLIGLGVAPEQVVGLCLERSPEMVIAILAVLKAGAAYLPLDPALPEERFSFLFNDVQPPVLLTQLQLLTQLPSEVAAADIVCLDLDENLISAHSLSNPSRQVSPDNLAYVIYTSGSTGVPKGVCITHRAIANHTLAVIDVFSLTSSDRVLQFATFNFDVSVEQLMSSLLCGATVVMRGAALWSVSELWRKVAAERLSVVNLPTAFWHQVVGESIDAEALAGSGDNGSGDGIGGNVGGSNGGDNGGGGLKNLRLMIAGGEKMQGAAVVQWRAKGLDGVRLLNAYGPTETTITATVHEVADSEQIEEGRGVKIGRVVGARNCYVLDERGEMVGSGVAGELYIGGEWLARGYRGRAEWTGERFVPDEWSGQAGARMYRTGDIVRRSVGGELEYVGRVDRQVKVRGNRVELEEVESVLMGLSGVLGAAVEMRKGASGEERLVAYIEVRKEEAGREGIVREAGDGDGDGDGKGEEKVGDKGDGKEVGGRGGRRQWREEMKERVPEYMVPQVYVEMERLPLTASGKIDREALPEYDGEAVAPESEFVAPRTPFEEELAGIWCELLGLSRVGVYDNFFELGGHSLLITQVASRIRKNFDVEVPLRILFEMPTVVGMSEAIAARQLGGEGAAEVAEMLDELKHLSPDEVKALLENEGQLNG